MNNINLLSSQPQTPQQPVIPAATPKTMPSHIVQPRNLQAGYVMVKIGLLADRPITTNEIAFYFATDTLTMYYFDSATSNWKTGTTFS